MPRARLLLLALLGLGAALPGLAQTPVQEELQAQQDPAQLERGAYLARAGDCAACHTAPGGEPYAGGRALQTPLGTLYSSNISPDPKTGIGSYSFADFDRAVRLGVAKGGLRLYPVMPYPSYAKLDEQDMRALYAYFLGGGVAAVKQENRDSGIPWPLNLRWPLALWNGLFLDAEPFQPRADQDAQWNRGAYLVQGLAHCGACHTPRGLGLQEQALDERTPGFLAGASLGGWDAYNITPHPQDGIGAWSDEELLRYLKTGALPGKSQAAGPMAEAVEHSLRHLTDDDLRAIVAYLRSVKAVGRERGKARHEWGTPAAEVLALRGVEFDPKKHDGARLFLGHCASCHAWTGEGVPDGYYPALLHNSTVGAASATNLIQVLLYGVRREGADGQTFMPGFAASLDDAQLAALVNYLTRQFGNPDNRVTAAQIAALRRP
ncbi:MAG: cytochrome c [Pseudomonas sp.]